MQYKEKIPIDKTTVQAIQNNHEDKLELLTESLLKEKETIISLLNNYDYYNDTHGQVYDFEIEDDSVFIESDGTGGFRVLFQVYYYFGCDDMNSEHDQEMSIEIIINLQNNEAELVGEFWKEREPDEF